MIILPVKKKVTEHYSELSDLLTESDIHETETVRAAFGIDTIDNVFEAKNEDLKDICIIESNGFFYHVFLPFDLVVSLIAEHRQVTQVNES